MYAERKERTINPKSTRIFPNQVKRFKFAQTARSSTIINLKSPQMDPK